MAEMYERNGNENCSAKMARNRLVFFGGGRQPGFPGYSAGQKRARPRPAGAPRVALPVKGRQPFWPLRGNSVNPCRKRLSGYPPIRSHFPVEFLSACAKNQAEGFHLRFVKA